MNRKLITISLLILTLVLGGLAVFLTITINNRNVNPDDTSAAQNCDQVYSSCMSSCRNSACGSEERAKNQCESGLETS